MNTKGATHIGWIRARLHVAAAAAALMIGAPCGAAEEARQLAPLPEAALATLRAEMLANLRAVHEIVGLLAAGKVQMAGEIAERELGTSAMGRNRSLPPEARPGPQMPAAMHAMGIEGHQAASRFAREAATGDRDRAFAALPAVMTSCVSCHHAYRTR